MVSIHRITIFLVFISLLALHFLYISFSDIKDKWGSCCKEGCDYKIGDSITFGGKTYYCCDYGWSSQPCPCNVNLESLSLTPDNTNRCGETINIRADVRYSASGNCKNQNITVFKPDGSELCKIPISIGTNLVGSCSGNYNVPTQSGNYSFKAVFGIGGGDDRIFGSVSSEKTTLIQFEKYSFRTIAVFGSSEKTANLTVNCLCNVNLESLTLNLTNTNRCGETIGIRADVRYSASGNCKNQNITVFKPDGSELCKIPISIGTNLV
ncbi:MAG: hypothetical protein QW367_03240, partial [Candidatus Aenigmatarchaeota archaeon]